MKIGLFTFVFCALSAITYSQNRVSYYYSAAAEAGPVGPYSQQYQAVLDEAALRGYAEPNNQVKNLQDELMRKFVRSGLYDSLQLIPDRLTNLIVVAGEDLDPDFALINWLNPSENTAVSVGSGPTIVNYKGATGTTNSVVRSGQQIFVTDTQYLHYNFSMGAFYVGGNFNSGSNGETPVGMVTKVGGGERQKFRLRLIDISNRTRTEAVLGGPEGGSTRLRNLVDQTVSGYPYTFSATREPGILRSYINGVEGNNSRSINLSGTETLPGQMGFFGLLENTYATSDTTSNLTYSAADVLQDTVAAIYFGARISPTLMDSFNIFLSSYTSQIEALNDTINVFSNLYLPDEDTVNLTTTPRLPSKWGTLTEAAWGRTGTTPTIWEVDTNCYECEGGFEAIIDSANNDGTPSVIVFSTSGTFERPDGTFKSVSTNQDSLIILGQTAPSPGVRLHDIELVLRGTDIYISHLRLGAGDDTLAGVARDSAINASGWTQYGERDALKVIGDRIVFDHCTFNFGTDEIAQATGADIVFNYCLFTKPLARAGHQKGFHPKGLIIIKQDSLGGERIVVNRCAFISTDDRMPQLGGQVRAIVQENYGFFGDNGFAGVYQAVKGRWTGDTLNGGFPVASVFNNQYDQIIKAPIRIYNKGVDSTGAIRLFGNLINGAAFDTSSLDDSQKTVIAEGPLDTITGTNYVPAYKLKKHVLTLAGARPQDRDTVELQAVDQVNKGLLTPPPDNMSAYDSIIQLPVNTTILNTPAGPFAKDINTGRSKLEYWADSLHWRVTYPASISWPGINDSTFTQ